MQKKIIYTSIIIVSLFLLLTASNAEAKIIREETFDTDLNGLHGYGDPNPQPVIQHDIVRHGTGAVYVKVRGIKQGSRRVQFMPNAGPDDPWRWNDAGADWPQPVEGPGSRETWLKRDWWFGVSIYIPPDFEPLTWTWPDGSTDHGWPFGGAGGELWWQMKTLAPKGWDTWPWNMALFVSYGRGSHPGSVENPIYSFAVHSGSFLDPKGSASKALWDHPVNDDIGHWVDWVWHIKMDPEGTEAFTALYRRRDDESSFTQVISEEEWAGIPNCFSEEGRGLHHSFGPYLYDLGAHGDYCEIDRELYFDEWRVGEGYSSIEEALAEMAPGGGGVVISPGPAPGPAPAPVVRSGIVREELFDDNFNGMSGYGTEEPYIVSNPVCGGSGSGHYRHITNKGAGSGNRRSMTLLRYDPNEPWVWGRPLADWPKTLEDWIRKEWWIGFAIYVPDDFEPLTFTWPDGSTGHAAPKDCVDGLGHSGGELWWQVHPYGTPPQITMYIGFEDRNESNPYRYNWSVRGRSTYDCSDNEIGFTSNRSRHWGDIMADRGHWREWVVHLVPDIVRDRDSFTEILTRRDDEKTWTTVVAASEWAGVENAVNSCHRPVLSWGPYLWDTSTDSCGEFSEISERVIYFDEYRIGNSTSSLASVAPSCGISPFFPPNGNGILPAPKPPTNPPVVDIQANGSDVSTTVRAGEQALLSWISVDATSCMASGDWEGSKGLSGQETTEQLYSSKIYTLTCKNTMGSASDSVVVNISDPNFSVFLEAFPSIGIVPLTNVDLRATVSGTAEGPITYRFDCEFDGDWNLGPITTDDTTYAATDLCSYDPEGTYTALVRVEREGNVATDTVNVTAAKANQVVVNPETQIITGQPEATISIDILNTAGLHDFSFDIVYDSPIPILLFKSLQRSTFLGSPDIVMWDIDTSTAGRVRVSAARNDVGYVNGSGTLATITFTVIKTGVQEVKIENLALNDEEGNTINPADPVLNGQIIVRSTATPPWWTTWKTGTARLVRCGLSYDDPDTEIDERCPCTLCHLFILFRIVLDFVLKLVFAVAAIFATLGGLYFIFGAPSPSTVNKGREILKSVAIGLVVIFSSWLIVNLIFMFIGVASIELRENWFRITCEIVCKR